MLVPFQAKIMGSLTQPLTRVVVISCLLCGSVVASCTDDIPYGEETVVDESADMGIDSVESPQLPAGILRPLEVEPTLLQPLTPLQASELSSKIDYRLNEDYFQTAADLETSLWQDIKSDYQIFYGRTNLQILLVGLALGGAVANTDIDTRFHQWQHGDSPIPSNQNQVAVIAKACGEGKYVFPVFASCYVLDELSRYELLPLDPGPIGEWGQRGVRSVVVGLPVLAVGQLLTGSSRPEELRGSTWRPFQDDNGISGHSFVGALPFLTAANMTNDMWAKSTLVFCSTLPAWSRLHDDAHYLSQAILGWGLAYLVCQSVSQTSDQAINRKWRLNPLLIQDGSAAGQSTGLGLSFELDF